jgi:hypothetical protein
MLIAPKLEMLTLLQCFELRCRESRITTAYCVSYQQVYG